MPNVLIPVELLFQIFGMAAPGWKYSGSWEDLRLPYGRQATLQSLSQVNSTWYRVSRQLFRSNLQFVEKENFELWAQSLPESRQGARILKTDLMSVLLRLPCSLRGTGQTLHSLTLSTVSHKGLFRLLGMDELKSVCQNRVSLTRSQAHPILIGTDLKHLSLLSVDFLLAPPEEEELLQHISFTLASLTIECCRFGGAFLATIFTISFETLSALNVHVVDIEFEDGLLTSLPFVGTSLRSFRASGDAPSLVSHFQKLPHLHYVHISRGWSFDSTLALLKNCSFLRLKALVLEAEPPCTVLGDAAASLEALLQLPATKGSLKKLCLDSSWKELLEGETEGDTACVALDEFVKQGGKVEWRRDYRW